MPDAGPAEKLVDETQYSARLILAYRYAALVVAGLSVFWAIVFAVLGNWVLSLSQVALTFVCITSWVLASTGRLTAALLLTQLTFFIYICGLCLVFDVPSADVPRVSHIFLLVLALLGYLNYKRHASAVQLVMVVVCGLAFIALSSSNYALPFADPIPDNVRYVGAWLNAAFASLMLAGCVYVFQLELERADRRVHELRLALWGRQFELFFQPQVNVLGHVTGAEALIRWKHPERGYVSPAEFVPIAEEAGLMNEIGHWVLETACRTLADWRRDADLRHLTLAVNVSASQFLDEDFEQSVVHLIDMFDIDPSLLKLEITESVMVTNTDQVVAKMQILRALGIGIALDDFGTGYSSLGYLRRLPLTLLKIDRSFVQEITENPRSAALVRSVISLGHDLGLTVLAEGVETQEQYVFLRENGCNDFQGFYFGRPVPLGEFEQALLRKVA